MAYTNETIHVIYLNKDGVVVGDYDTESPVDEMKEWADWMNDPSVEHFDEPEEWDTFELVLK